jgi:signal peptidase I
MEQENDKKVESKMEEKKSSKGKVAMYVWLASVVVFVLSFTNIFGSFTGLPFLLSILIGGISLVVWATKSKAGKKALIVTILLPVIFFLIYLFVVRPHKLLGNTMSPTFKGGDYVLVEKLSYYFGSPKRGDVVIYMKQSNNSSEYFGRILGLPNETVSLKPGEIKINGNVLTESRVSWGNLPSVSKTWPAGVVTLKGDEYFVFSDNQDFTSPESANFSTDQDVIQNALQKFLEDSVIKKSDISGKVLLKYWPF